MPTIERYEGTTAEWDAFVRECQGWSHCHLYGWRSIMEEVLGHECIYLAALDEDGRLDGVLPLVRVRSVLFGHYLVSMPFLNYGGPLGSERAVVALADHAADRARRERVKLLELRSRQPLPLDMPVSHRKITVVLDLSGGREAVWKALGGKLRSQIRRPQKEEVEVRFGLDQCGPFHEVFARHMRDLGTPAQPIELFEAIARTFPDDAWFGCAWLDGRPVAGGAGFRWGDELEMTWASSLVEHKRIAPNMLLYWSFMERAMEAGVRVFNFGRCTPGGGTHRFKQQWGSRDEPLWWYDLSTTGARTPSGDDATYAWGSRLWRRLPLAVANSLGPRIVRCIP